MKKETEAERVAETIAALKARAEAAEKHSAYIEETLVLVKRDRDHFATSAKKAEAEVQRLRNIIHEKGMSGPDGPIAPTDGWRYEE